MTKIFISSTISLIALLFISCATPQIIEEVDENELKLVLIKSQNIKFYDFGYLQVASQNNENLIQDSTQNNTKQSTLPENIIASLEVFTLGKSIGRFTIKENEICFINDCAQKLPASKAFFGNVSYGDLFEDILLKKDIFNGKGKQINANGVIIQHFTYDGEEIYYERKKGVIFFQNRTNGVTVSIEDYKNNNP